MRFASLTPVTLAFLSAASVTTLCYAADAPILPQLPTSSLIVASTVPANGDVNPYGVAFVPHGFPDGNAIHRGDVLVSNFNNSGNLQGTGTTIVSISRDGTQNLFFQGPAGLGLTTALGVLQRGVVLVGNVPTKDGSFATIQQGSLIAIDRNGKEIASFSDSTLLDGPWDLAVVDMDSTAMVFVSNVLNGTVTRLLFHIGRNGEHISLDSATQIGKGYLSRSDPAALVVGPTGLAFDANADVLFVASTGDNAIYSIEKASTRSKAVNKGQLVYSDDAHLRGPLGLVIAPNGHLITANGDAVNGDPTQPSELVEFTRKGRFVAQQSVDLGGQGGAFGIAIHGSEDHLRLAAVDDITNTLEIWTVRE
ncbi:MAG: hypothetical protein JO061_11230 [Acidobacteriaceae bacterium]|nr:hypothetical protein [Acidobacteriaceae bacterium]